MAKSSLLIALARVSLMVLSMGGCSSASHVPATSPMAALPPSTAPVPAKRLWTHRAFGLITDLNLSSDGSTVLVATVPDHDSLAPGTNTSGYYVTFYSRSGNMVSRTEMPAQVKSQAISDDGSFAVIATYDDQIRGVTRAGKELWSTEASCKPILLGGPEGTGSPKKILCFHDDDAEPDLGFEVFSWKGKRLSDFPIHDDALGLKVSPDEKSFILALTHGRVIVFNSLFQPIIREKVPGEIVDVAISSRGKSRGSKPSFAVLYNSTTRRGHSVSGVRQKLMYFRSHSSQVILVSGRVEMIAIPPDGGAVFGYSNTDSGQLLVRLSEEPSQEWRRQDSKTAEYSSHVIATRKGVWVGFQDARVLGYDSTGRLLTDIRAPGDEGAFLYSFALSRSGRIVVVAMDEGSLSLFKVAR